MKMIFIMIIIDINDQCSEVWFLRRVFQTQQKPARKASFISAQRRFDDDDYNFDVDNDNNYYHFNVDTDNDGDTVVMM